MGDSMNISAMVHQHLFFLGDFALLISWSASEQQVTDSFRELGHYSTQRPACHREATGKKSECRAMKVYFNQKPKKNGALERLARTIFMSCVVSVEFE